jgi:hypothetical protein
MFGPKRERDDEGNCIIITVTFSSLHQKLLGDQTRKDEMGWNKALM